MSSKSELETPSSQNMLDILILGATGFTGIHCIPYVHELSKDKGRNLKWGIAGRSEEKLKKALQKVGKEIDADLSSTPIITADINNYDSLLEMAKKTRLVINCCGPFRYLGDVVVKACIEAGTHHVDVSGEPEYMERVQLEQHEHAQKQGVYVISACGFDSIPSDMGVVFLQKEFDGTLNSVETFLNVWIEGSHSGPAINYGTWNSAVESIANTHKLKEIRSRAKAVTKKLPHYVPRLPLKTLPHKSDRVSGWVLPFLGADRSVIRRSQQYFYEVDNKRPVQIGTYFTVPSTLTVILMAIYGLIFAILARFELGRKLLLNYPSIFTGGMFGKEQPSEERVKNSKFTITLYGEGWKEKLSNKDDQYNKPVDRYILGKVTGTNPGYGATCLTLVLAGILVLTEKEKLAGNGKGGVYPPGAAFAKTSIIEELSDNGLTFEIIYQKDL